MTLNGLTLVNIFVEGYNENHICILLSMGTLVLFLLPILGRVILY